MHVLEVARGLAARGPRGARGGRTPTDGAAARGGRRASSGTASRWRPAPPVLPLPRAARRWRPSRTRRGRRWSWSATTTSAARASAPPPRRGIPSAARGELARRGPPGLGSRRALDAVLLVRPLRRYRESLCRQAAALVSPAARRSCPSSRARKTETVTWGANVDAFSPGPAARRASGASWGSRRARWPSLFSGSFRPWHGVHVLEAAARRLRGARRPLLPARGRPAARGRRRATAAGGWARVPYERDARRSWPPPTSASRPTTPPRLRQLRARLLLVAAQDLRVHGLAACPRSRSRARRSPTSCATGQEGLHVARGRSRAPWPRAIVRLADDAALRARAWARAPARAWSSATPGPATASSSRACCGGSRREGGPGQRGLPAARGRARAGRRGRWPWACARPATTSPCSPRARARRTSTACASRRLSARGPASAWPCRARSRARLRGARTATSSTPSTRSPPWARWPGRDPGRVAVTVRDHWPVCFWSTRISRGALCPGCGIAPMTRCVRRPRAARRRRSPGARSPTCRATSRLKRAALRRAGATLAVSEAIAEELRAAGIPRVEVHPEHRGRARGARGRRGRVARSPLPERFLLFVGKLEENKGARLLVPAVAAARTGLPLVVLGEGSLAHALKFEAAAAGVAAAPARLGGARGRAARAGARHRARLPLPLAGAALARAAGGPGPGHAGGGHGHRRHARDPGRRARRACW